MKCHQCGFESDYEICPLCGIKKIDLTTQEGIEYTKKKKKASDRKTLLIILLCLSPVIIYAICVLVAMAIGYFEHLDKIKHLPAPNEKNQILFDNSVYEKNEVIDLEWGRLEFTGIEPAPLDASFNELYHDNIYEINLKLTNTSDKTYMISYETIKITDSDNSVIVDDPNYIRSSKGIDPNEVHEIKAVAVICQPENELEFTYDFSCLTGNTSKYSYNFSHPIP